MISGDMQIFQRKVINDFIRRLSSHEFLMRELEQNNIPLHQIEKVEDSLSQKMEEKLKNTQKLFKKLTGTYNEIEKQMLQKATTYSYASICQQIDSNDSDCKEGLSMQEMPIDDGSASDFHHFDKNSESKMESGVKIENIDVSEEEMKRETRSDNFSMLSEVELDHQNSLCLRSESQIHILGTYGLHSKQYNPKEGKTQIQINDVFIKTKGINRQIFVKKLKFICKKKNSE